MLRFYPPKNKRVFGLKANMRNVRKFRDRSSGFPRLNKKVKNIITDEMMLADRHYGILSTFSLSIFEKNDT